MEWEDGILRNGEVVYEAARENDSTDRDGRSHNSFRVRRVSEVGQSDEEDRKSGGEEEQASKIQLGKFLPASLVVIITRT